MAYVLSYWKASGCSFNDCISYGTQFDDLVNMLGHFVFGVADAGDLQSLDGS